MKQHLLFCFIFISLFSPENIFSQTIRFVDAQSKTPIEDVMVIWKNKLIATSNIDGIAKIKEVDSDSKLCTKAFGYHDTCFVLRKNVIEILLRSKLYETSEVTITANEESPKEQFIRFLTHSASLANQEEELRSYRFQIIYTPDTADVFDRMDGVFSYYEPSNKKRMKFTSLYPCQTQHSITENLFNDSLSKTNMDRGTLPYAMMHFYHLCSPYIKSYKKRILESKLNRTITDSSFIYTYIDSTWYPVRLVWIFDKGGRLQEYVSTTNLEESKRSIVHYQGKQHSHYIYTREGLLKPKYVTIAENFSYKTEFSYTVKINLSIEETICPIDKDLRIPISYSPSTWAKYRNIPTIIIDQ